MKAPSGLPAVSVSPGALSEPGRPPQLDDVASPVTVSMPKAKSVEPRRQRQPVHSTSAPALPTISRKRGAVVATQLTPPVPAPCDRTWGDAPRAIPAFSFGRAARFDFMREKLRLDAQQASAGLSGRETNGHRTATFGGSKARVPASPEARLLIDTLREQLRSNKDKIKNVLDTLDTNGDGELDRTELRKALRAVMNSNGEASEADAEDSGEPSDQAVEEVIRVLDLDGSETIGTHELKRALWASGQLLDKRLRAGGAGKMNVYGVNTNALRAATESLVKIGAKLLGPDGQIPEGGIDGKELLEQTRAQLCTHREQVIGIFQGEGDRVVTRAEFCNAVSNLFGMRPSIVGKLGSQALLWAVNNLFLEWDVAFVGLSVPEINKILYKGGRTAIARRRKVDAIAQSEISSYAAAKAAQAMKDRSKAQSESKHALNGIVIQSKEEQLQKRADRVAPVQLEALLQVMAAETDVLLDLFLKWDTDGDGTVCREEFVAACRKMGFKFAPEVSDELFSFFDKDGSGSVTLEEIEATLKWGRDRKKNSRPLMAGWRQLSLKISPDEPLHQQLTNKLKELGKVPGVMFKHWDEDGNGSLDRRELGQLMFVLCGMILSDEELARLFESFDKNGSGNITFKELNAKLREEVPIEQLMNAVAESSESLFDLFHSRWDSSGDVSVQLSNGGSSLRLGHQWTMCLGR